MSQTAMRPDPTIDTGRASRVRTAAVVLAALVWAALLYRPWAAAPFEPVDFSFTLPVLLAGRSALERAATLTEQYVTVYGRLIPVTLTQIAFEWSAFGWHTLGWQILAFAVAATNLALCALLLRRFGCSIPGVAGGAALFVVAAPAIPLWIGLHNGEPIGTLLFLAAALLLSDYRGSSRWRQLGAAAGALTVLSVLAKETMIACVPFLIIVGLCHVDGRRWALPTRTRRSGLLVAWFTVLSVGLAGAILATKLHAPHESYGAQYSLRTQRLTGMRSSVLGMLLPIDQQPVALANLALVVIVAAGCLMALRDPNLRKEFTFPAVVGLVLPLSGAVIYLPWFYFRPDYAYPFLLGAAMLVAVSLTTVGRHGSVLPRHVAFAAALLIVLLGSRLAHRSTSETLARRAAYGDLMIALRRLVVEGSATRLGFVVDSANWYSPWLALRVERFANIVIGQRLPPAAQVSCTTARTRPGSRTGVALIASTADCPELADADAPSLYIVRHWHYLSLRRGVRPDSVRFNLWLPPRAGSAPRRPAPAAATALERRRPSTDKRIF